MRPVILLGYGNTLRSDDGIGPRLAERLAERAGPPVTAISCRQLFPEHVEAILAADLVVFIDARHSLPPGRIHCQPLDPSTLTPGPTTHHVRPEHLLAFARELFAHCPTAWVVSVGVASLAFGDQLSPPLADRLETLVAELHACLIRWTTGLRGASAQPTRRPADA